MFVQVLGAVSPQPTWIESFGLSLFGWGIRWSRMQTLRFCRHNPWFSIRDHRPYRACRLSSSAPLRQRRMRDDGKGTFISRPPIGTNAERVRNCNSQLHAVWSTDALARVCSPRSLDRSKKLEFGSQVPAILDPTSTRGTFPLRCKGLRGADS